MPISRLDSRPCCLHRLPALFILICAAAGLAACGNGETHDPAFTVEGEGLSIESPWVRPGSEGRMSAGYFLLTNFDEQADTLTGISSDVAQLTEIHESYETDDGMMGMREVSNLPIPAGETLQLQPGGLHIMFIQLLQELNDGDQVDVTLHFANHEDLTVSMPVQP